MKIKNFNFFLVLGLMFIAQVSFASSSVFNGVYVGAQGGISLAIFDEQGDSALSLSRDKLSNLHYFAHTDTDMSDVDVFGGLNVGIGYVLKRLYLGVELNGDLGSVDAHANLSPQSGASPLFTSTRTQAKLVNDYGIVLKPGFIVTPTLMLFTEFGAEGSKLETSSTVTYANIPGFHGGSFISANNASGDVAGFRTGLGIEKYAGHHMDFFAEYLVTIYGHVRSNGSLPILLGANPGSAIRSSSEYSAWTNNLMVGMNVRFG